jgi:O-methyltransferase involved in polyketide biosynthesis
MKTTGIDLGSVQKTLLLPLWGRAVETQRKKPLLVDETAVRIVNSLDYDFSILTRTVHPLTQAAWIARSLYFDRKLKVFLQNNPAGTVINIGCGLDTTYDRVDNGKVRWYELDLPDVIELRRHYIRPDERRVFIAGSVLDNAWYSQIRERQAVLLLFAGVIYYFREDILNTLFNKIADCFGRCQILFDYASLRGKDIANKRLLEKSGMADDARLVWGTDDLYEIEKWDKGIKVLETIPMFTEHRKNYPVIKRLGMAISDKMKFMSLAHIEVQ